MSDTTEKKEETSSAPLAPPAPAVTPVAPPEEKKKPISAAAQEARRNNSAIARAAFLRKAELRKKLAETKQAVEEQAQSLPAAVAENPVESAKTGPEQGDLHKDEKPDSKIHVEIAQDKKEPLPAVTEKEEKKVEEKKEEPRVAKPLATPVRTRYTSAHLLGKRTPPPVDVLRERFAAAPKKKRYDFGMLM